NGLLDRREVLETAAVRLYLEAPCLEQLQFLPVRARREPPFDRLDGKDEQPEPPLAGDGGIELAQGAGGGIAGIGKERLADPLPLLVDALESLVGQVHLA